LADDNLVEFLIEIDINETQSVRKKFLEVISNKKNEDRLNRAKEFFDQSLSKEKMANTFAKIFTEYKFIQERWKE
jgi:hypothetical protein